MRWTWLGVKDDLKQDPEPQFCELGKVSNIMKKLDKSNRQTKAGYALDKSPAPSRADISRQTIIPTHTHTYQCFRVTN